MTAGDFIMAPPAELTHDPCCSSHGARLGCEAYRRSHFVEVGPCCEVWAMEHPEYGTATNPTRPEPVAPVDERPSRLAVAWEGKREWTLTKRSLSLDNTKPGDSSINARITDEGNAAVMPLTADQARDLAHELIIRADLIDPKGAGRG